MSTQPHSYASHHDFYTSLDAALQAARVAGIGFVTLLLSVNKGRVTVVEYRRTFMLEEAADNQTTEMTVMTALLRKFGKTKGKGARPYELRFTLSHDHTFVSENLARWIEERAGVRDTVPVAVVETITDMPAAVERAVEREQRRVELEKLNVEQTRKLASSLKLAGAWRRKKGELIESILDAETEPPTVS